MVRVRVRAGVRAGVGVRAGAGVRVKVGVGVKVGSADLDPIAPGAGPPCAS